MDEFHGLITKIILPPKCSASSRILFRFQDLDLSPDLGTLVLSGILFHLFWFQPSSILLNSANQRCQLTSLLRFQDLDFSPDPRTLVLSGVLFHLFCTLSLFKTRTCSFLEMTCTLLCSDPGYLCLVEILGICSSFVLGTH